jgi:hypothetical protein
MIFVTSECSKMGLVREALSSIYDGIPKSFSRGDILFFIPTKGIDPYTPDQHSKFMLNHDSYLGEGDVIAIHGLQDLNTEITLKGGKTTDIRTLLKSLPATTGMFCNRLFKAVHPNAGLTCTIATFQKCNKPFIEHRKPMLEPEIQSVLAPGQSSKVILDDIEGLWFGGTVEHQNGKSISVQGHIKEDIIFLWHANTLLNSS